MNRDFRTSEFNDFLNTGIGNTDIACNVFIFTGQLPKNRGVILNWLNPYQLRNRTVEISILKE